MKKKKLFTKEANGEKRSLPLQWCKLDYKERREMSLEECFLFWKEISVESRDKIDCWIAIKGKARTKKQLRWLLGAVPKDGMEEFEIEAIVKARSSK